MPQVVVPTAPPLARINRVELMHAGTWSAMSGVHTFSADDFYSAVAALDCPAVRRPVLKLGHVDPRFDGEPAVGWIDGLTVAEEGLTLLGDYVGMPGWLGEVIASAYPDRSIEGQWNYRCQIGHTHPFVLTGVALLGVQSPAIGTLQSLQDVAALYGVAAAEPLPTGVPVAVTVRATKEPEMPDPRPTPVAASVSVEDVRRAYYDDAPWSYWITEVHLDPMQLVVVDDDSGKRFRVPVEVTGEDSFSFGDPVEVLIRYVDKPETVAASGGPLVFASRGESRPGPKPEMAIETTGPEPAAPPAEPPADDTPEPEPPAPELPAAEPEPTTENEEDPVSDLSEFRSRLGLDETADEAAILAAFDARLQPSEPITEDPADDIIEVEPERELVAASTPALPEGVVTIDAETLAELRRNAQLGASAHERQRVSDRDTTILAARDDGRIPPSRVEYWKNSWEADPEGTKATLAALEPGLIPVTLSGTSGPAEPEADEFGVPETALAGWAAQLGIDAKELTRG